jgi:hypothetical protein
MHRSIEKGAEGYTRSTGNEIFVTPITFLTFIETFMHLFKLRVEELQKLKQWYGFGLE